MTRNQPQRLDATNPELPYGITVQTSLRSTVMGGLSDSSRTHNVVSELSGTAAGVSAPDSF